MTRGKSFENKAREAAIDLKANAVEFVHRTNFVDSSAERMGKMLESDYGRESIREHAEKMACATEALRADLKRMARLAELADEKVARMNRMLDATEKEGN